MSEYYVIVAGNGETSRANIEALMEDFYYANGDKGYLVLPYTSKPSSGQVFAAQYAKEQNKDILVFATGDANHTGVPSSSIHEAVEPLSESFKVIGDTRGNGAKVSAFLLWSDEDPESQQLLASCKQFDIPCFDLTDGLTPISAAPDIKPIETPKIPVQETLPVASDEEEFEDEDDEDDEEEYEDDEEELEDLDALYQGVESIARVFARVFIEEWKKANENPKP